jgi:DNA invertase Pin-like site-specific DNA recombinase
MRRLQDLKNKGIKTISITEQAFNMDGEFSDLLQYIMTWFNNYYLSNLKSNIKSGLERAKKNGKKLGRPKKQVNHYEVMRLKNQGLSLRQIAKETGMSLGMVQRCIKKVTPEN